MVAGRAFDWTKWAPFCTARHWGFLARAVLLTITVELMVNDWTNRVEVFVNTIENNVLNVKLDAAQVSMR